MYPGIPAGLTTTEFQTLCAATTLSINTHNQEDIRTKALRSRVQNLKNELHQARRHVANGEQIPPERAAYLNREYPLVMAEIQQTNSVSSKPASDSVGSTRRNSSSARHLARNILPGAKPESAKNSAVIHAPIPHRPLQDTPSGHTHGDIYHRSHVVSYSVPPPNTQPRAATTHPLPVPSPLSPPRTGSVNNVNDLSHRISPAAARQKQEIRGHSLSYRHQPQSPLRPLIIPSHSCRRSESPFPPSPTRVADVQMTYANCFGERSDSPDCGYFEDDFPFPPSRAVSPSSTFDQLCAKSPFNEYSWPVRPSTPTPLSPQNLDICKSGRRSARGWHNVTSHREATDNLHRLLLAKIQNDKSQGNFNEKREFRVCYEDEDNLTPAEIIVIDRPDIVKPSQSATDKSTRVQCEKAERQVTQHEEANSAGPERLSTDSPSPDIATLSKLATVLKDVDLYRQFLSFTGVDAQTILDVLQLLLDTHTFPDHARNQLITAMRRLSEKTECYPLRFNLYSPVQVLEDSPAKSGSYADVYKALFEGEHLCLKVIRVYQTSSARHTSKICAREVIPWGQLSHPNLLPFYGLYSFRSQNAFVSPWAENGHLGDFLAKNPCSNRVLLCSDAAAGLTYLHENDIVHGDIKQANILVDSSGRACLADFGLSSVTDPQILHWATASSVASKGGSIRWQAPELHIPESDNAFTEKAVQNSKESDVFAWACLCYEAFTGYIPFFESTRESTVIVRISRGGHPTRPSDGTSPWTERGLNTQIWDIMESCWKFEPQERPNISVVISRLAPIMPVDTRPPPQWQGTSAMRFRNLQCMTFKCRQPTLEDLDAILSRLL